MQTTKALTLGLMLAAAAALLPQNASAQRLGMAWRWMARRRMARRRLARRHGGDGVRPFGTGLAVGALAAAPYYGYGYYGYPAYPYGYGYPGYAYGYDYPYAYDYGYPTYPRCYYRGGVRVCH